MRIERQLLAPRTNCHPTTRILKINHPTIHILKINHPTIRILKINHPIIRLLRINRPIISPLIISRLMPIASFAREVKLNVFHVVRWVTEALNAMSRIWQINRKLGSNLEDQPLGRSPIHQSLNQPQHQRQLECPKPQHMWTLLIKSWE